jgi:hypothetical protein
LHVFGKKSGVSLKKREKKMCAHIPNKLANDAIKRILDWARNIMTLRMSKYVIYVVYVSGCFKPARYSMSSWFLEVRWYRRHLYRTRLFWNIKPNLHAVFRTKVMDWLCKLRLEIPLHISIFLLASVSWTWSLATISSGYPIQSWAFDQ